MPDISLADQLSEAIFGVEENTFEECALKVFHFQYTHNPVYREYAKLLRRTPDVVNDIRQIPFLPVSFFKTHLVSCHHHHDLIFESSRTTSQIPSHHYVANISMYNRSLIKSFEMFFGSPSRYVFLFLLPSYQERKNASLVYMAKQLMYLSGKKLSGFYLNDYDRLNQTIHTLEKNACRYILFGVSFALLDFAENFPQKIRHGILIETGGMKGRRREMIREELHERLHICFSVKYVFSEYGMTELLSQAYLKEDRRFHSPPWMKVLIRDPYNPLGWMPANHRGGINIIDLANLYSCSFIETQDIGVLFDDGSFDVLGRIDYSDLRGCNLMYD